LPSSKSVNQILKGNNGVLPVLIFLSGMHGQAPERDRLYIADQKSISEKMMTKVRSKDSCRWIGVLDAFLIKEH
jgi:hypothetical protein